MPLLLKNTMDLLIRSCGTRPLLLAQTIVNDQIAQNLFEIKIQATEDCITAAIIFRDNWIIGERGGACLAIIKMNILDTSRAQSLHGTPSRY